MNESNHEYTPEPEAELDGNQNPDRTYNAALTFGRLLPFVLAENAPVTDPDDHLPHAS